MFQTKVNSKNPEYDGIYWVELCEFKCENLYALITLQQQDTTYGYSDHMPESKAYSVTLRVIRGCEDASEWETFTEDTNWENPTPVHVIEDTLQNYMNLHRYGALFVQDFAPLFAQETTKNDVFKQYKRKLGLGFDNKERANDFFEHLKLEFQNEMKGLEQYEQL